MQRIVLTTRFEEALVYASHLHARQTRKSSPVPYIAHLLAVTALVLEDGGAEEEAIAALLHDAVEDQGGSKILEEIRTRFGEKVALIVDGCTDAYQKPKPPWRERKERFIEKLRASPPEVYRVSLADKLHKGRNYLPRSHKDTKFQNFVAFMKKKNDVPVILVLVSDLYFGVLIDDVALKLGYEVRRIEDIDRVDLSHKIVSTTVISNPVEILQNLEPALILIDLADRSIAWQDWIPAAKAHPATRQIPIVGYGPHVDSELLKAARKAGADAVLARSRFKSALAGVIEKYALKDIGNDE